jgi:dipeptidyl aminopeptidase/acylaminoacyl peptidase
MTTDSRLSRDLPEILGDLATGSYPDYIDDVLATSATIRQRPAWTFPERWLPMVDLVRQPVLVPRLPWRSIALAVVVLVALLAAAAVYIGGQQRLPAPFGPARNGVIAYDAGGDIYTADPVSGTTSALVTDPGRDVGPRYSLDGTHMAFARIWSDGHSQIYVARSDGSGLTLVTPTPLSLAAGDTGRSWERYKFSPDGRELLIATVSGITIARTDGSGASDLDVGMLAVEPTYRPPDGREILFIGRGAEPGLFIFDRTTNRTREVVKMNPGFDLAGASWSPDGSKIAYWTWDGTADGLTAKSHVVRADGSVDRELPSPPGALWNAHATWSNDGQRLFLARGYTPGEDDVRGYVVPADGGSFGVQIAPAGSVETGCCAAWLWSPDDSELLGRPTAPADGVPMVVLSATGGPVRTAPFGATSDPTWQRLAP